MDPVQTKFASPSEVPPSGTKDGPKKDFTLVVILSITTLLGVLIAIFFYLQNQQLRKLIAIVPPPAGGSTPSASPIATPDPTADWKVYTNTKYNFSFKYPNTETTKITNYTGYLSSISLINTETKFEDVVFSVGNTDGSLGYNKNDKNYIVSTTSIAGIEATRVSLPIGQNPAQELVFFINAGKFYNFQFIWDGKDQEALNTFDQILSTFKFTEVLSTPSASPL